MSDALPRTELWGFSALLGALLLLDLAWASMILRMSARALRSGTLQGDIREVPYVAPRETPREAPG